MQRPRDSNHFPVLCSTWKITRCTDNYVFPLRVEVVRPFFCIHTTAMCMCVRDVCGARSGVWCGFQRWWKCWPQCWWSPAVNSFELIMFASCVMVDPGNCLDHSSWTNFHLILLSPVVLWYHLETPFLVCLPYGLSSDIFHTRQLVHMHMITAINNDHMTAGICTHVTSASFKFSIAFLASLSSVYT